MLLYNSDYYTCLNLTLPLPTSNLGVSHLMTTAYEAFLHLINNPSSCSPLLPFLWIIAVFLMRFSSIQCHLLIIRCKKTMLPKHRHSILLPKFFFFLHLESVPLQKFRTDNSYKTSPKNFSIRMLP